VQPSDLLRQWLPIGVSLLSLVLAGIALGWNIYRDVILKARVRVQFAVVSIVAPGERGGERTKYLKIGVTNHGPGPVKVQMIIGQNTPLWRRLVRRPRHFVIVPDYSNPLSAKLPHRLDVGEDLTLLLPYSERCLLGREVTHIGVSDSFGRYHYAPRWHLRDAWGLFAKDYPFRV